MKEQYKYLEVGILDLGSIKTNLRSTGSKYIIQYNVLNGLSLYETEDTTKYSFGRGVRSNYDVHIFEHNGKSYYVDEAGRNHLVSNGYIKLLGLKVVKEEDVYKIYNGNTTYKFELIDSKYLLTKIENSDGTSETIERTNNKISSIKRSLIKGHNSDEVINITYGLTINLTYSKFGTILTEVTLTYNGEVLGKRLTKISAGNQYEYQINRLDKNSLISKRIIFKDTRTELTQVVTFDDNDEVDSIKDTYDKYLTITREYSKTILTDSNGKTITYVFEGNKLNHIVNEDNMIQTYAFDDSVDFKLLSEFVLDLKHPSKLGELLDFSDKSISGGYSLVIDNMVSPITNTEKEGVSLSIFQDNYEYEEKFNESGKKEQVTSVLVYSKGFESDYGEPGFLDVFVRYYDSENNLLDESQKIRINIEGQENKYYMFSSYSKKDYAYFKVVCSVIAGEGLASLLIHAFKNGQVGRTYFYDEVSGRVNKTIDNKKINTYSYNENGGLISVNNNIVSYHIDEDENGVITETIITSDGLGNETKIIKENGLLLEKTTSYLDNVVNKEEYTYVDGKNIVSTYKLNDITYTFTYDNRFKITGVTSSNGLTTINEYYGTTDLFPDSLKSITKKVGSSTKGKCTIIDTKSTGIDTTLTNLNTSPMLIDRDAYQRVRNVTLGGISLAQFDFGNTSYPDIVTRFNKEGYVLNNEGNVVGVVDVQTNNAVGTFTYADELITRMQGNGFDTRYTYDNNGKLKQIRSQTDNITLNKTRNKDDISVGEEIIVGGSKGFVEHSVNVEKEPDYKIFERKVFEIEKTLYISSIQNKHKNDEKKINLYSNKTNNYIPDNGNNTFEFMSQNGIRCYGSKGIDTTYELYGLNVKHYGVFIKASDNTASDPFLQIKTLNEEMTRPENLYMQFCIREGYLYVWGYTDYNNVNKVKDISIIDNKWHYLSIEIIDETVYIMVDGDVAFEYESRNNTIKIDTIKFYSLIDNRVLFAESLLARQNLEEERMEIIDAFNKNVNEFENSNMDFSCLGRSTYAKLGTHIEDGNTLELITLHKNEVSTAGRKPVNELKDDTNDVDKNYVYDEEKKCFVYNNSKLNLSYKLTNVTSGTIMFNAKLNNGNNLFLSLIDSENKSITLSRALSTISVKVINSFEYQGKLINNLWHNYAITWKKTEEGLNFILYFDGKEIFNITNNRELLDNIVLIFEDGVSFVEDLRLSTSSLTSSQINANISRAKFNIEKDYNTSGNIISKTIYNKGSEIRKTNYEYYSNNRLGLQNDETNQIVYEYDSFDNITRQVFNGNSTEYVYDGLNRLVRCNSSNFTRQYLFDDRGNITRVIKENGPTPFIYDEYNRLREFGLGYITYPSTSDESSMYPSSIANGNEVTNLTWTRGKLTQLLKTNSGVQVLRNEYTYDLFGLRVKKLSYDSNNVLTTSRYFYDEKGLLKGEARTRNGSSLILKYYYDEQDSLVAFSINGTMYFYLKDAKNEIYGIMNSSGNIVGTYTYDPYGNILSISNTSSNSPLVINPFRYKGYYYDDETQLFYCNSRYYSPELCRFISPDSIEYLDPQSINGLNLYCYCMNNPIMYADLSGHMPEWLSTTLKIIGGVAIIAGCVVGSIFTGGALSVVLAGAAIGATVGGIGAGISTAVSGGDIHDFANAFLMSTATGAISGAVAASPLGVGAQIGINAALGAANYAGTQLLSGGNITLGGLIVNAGIGALCGWIGQSGWMQGQTTSAFVAFAGKNALKHVVGMVGTETLLRMTLPAFLLGGVGGGIYGRLSAQFNPNGNFIGI